MVSPRSGVTTACTRRVGVRGFRSHAGLLCSVDVTAMSDSWREVAACAETDPDAFFPAKGESSRPAKQLCGGCPVKWECLEDALNTDDVRHGVRGGLGPRDRVKLLRGRQQLKDAA